jgi:uncharacterized repeat protein (TIGR01451 family)
VTNPGYGRRQWCFAERYVPGRPVGLHLDLLGLGRRHLPERERQRQYRHDDEHDRRQRRHAELQRDLHAGEHRRRLAREPRRARATSTIQAAANNSVTDTDTINARADLSIANSDGVSAIVPGTSTTYAITVTNPASVSVSNVSVADTFPGTLSGCSWTCIAIERRRLPERERLGQHRTTTNTIAGSNGTLGFSATCTLSAAASGSLANTASVSYGNDIVAANNNATDTDSITPLADLSVAVSDGAASVNAGATVSYTITATNPSTSAVSPSRSPTRSPARCRRVPGPVRHRAAAAAKARAAAATSPRPATRSRETAAP